MHGSSTLMLLIPVMKGPRVARIDYNHQKMPESRESWRNPQFNNRKPTSWVAEVSATRLASLWAELLFKRTKSPKDRAVRTEYVSQLGWGWSELKCVKKTAKNEHDRNKGNPSASARCLVISYPESIFIFPEASPHHPPPPVIGERVAS